MFGSFCKGASFVGANLRNADLEASPEFFFFLRNLKKKKTFFFCALDEQRSPFSLVSPSLSPSLSLSPKHTVRGL